MADDGPNLAAKQHQDGRIYCHQSSSYVESQPVTKKLPLAVEIADEAKAGDRKRSPLDIGKTASKLHDAHPEADSSTEDIADALRGTSETSTKG
jgi:hypothetical protein